MSVVIAAKENGIVYMGADTRTSTGSSCKSYLQETNYKITKLSNGILIGHSGKVRASQEFERIFTRLYKLDPEKGLTKKDIVTKIIPVVRGQFEALELFDKDRYIVELRVLIAYKDKLIYIDNDLTVWDCGCMAIGIGDQNGLGFVINRGGKDVCEAILEGLRYATKSMNYIGAPYVLINSKDLEYKICE